MSDTQADVIIVGAGLAGLVAACEGAVILSRAEQTFEPFDLVAAEQLAAIEAAMKSKS